MRKRFTRFIRATSFILLMLAVLQATAQRNYAPLSPGDFNLTLENDVQTAGNILEFDVYLLDTDITEVFELGTVQAGILVNPAIYNGGTITMSIIAGSSQLVTAQQPTSVVWSQAQNTIKLTPKPGPGSGNATIISTTAPGTRVCRLRMTNTADFAAGTTADLTLNFTTVPYPTKVSHYVGGINTPLVTNATNCFSNLGNIVLNPVTNTLNLKLYLEGLYAGSGTLNKAQGSSGDQYPGTTADQVTVELRDPNTGAVVFSLANVNMSTGGIISINTIPGGLSNSYYITIRHRNSIETTSASAISFAGNTISYDFTTSASQAYGNNQKDVGEGTFAIWSGDVNQDGAVDSNDMGDVDNDANNFISGYVVTDVNGDGVVDSNDMGIVDNNSNMFVVAVTP